MTDTDIRAQIENDAMELRVMASEYPPGSMVRLAFIGFATMLAEEYSLTDTVKVDLTLNVLDRVQPCTKQELAERLDFSRDESRRVIDLGIQLGMIEQYQEPTNGRPRILLRIP